MTEHSETEWLDEEERAAWIGLMTLFFTLPAALDRQLRAESSMTHFDYQVMVILSGVPNRSLRMSELATLTEGSLPRLSQVVRRHEESGWIERRPDPDDGRSTLAILTDAGFDALAAAAPGHVAEVRRLVFDPLSRTQVHQLERIATRILSARETDAD
ncbi:MAG: MarR family winged helix-turn-helix transcriptional regulator [Ilumatobacter sp.]